jgi:hypothetical protein
MAALPEAPAHDFILMTQILACSFAILCNTSVLSEHFISVMIASPIGFSLTVESTDFLITLTVGADAVPISL